MDCTGKIKRQRSKPAMGQGQSYVAEEERRKAEELERQRQIAEERTGKFKGYLVRTGSKAVAIAVFTTCICLSLSVWYRQMTGKEPKSLFGVEKIHLEREPTGQLRDTDSSFSSSGRVKDLIDESEHLNLKPLVAETTTVLDKALPPSASPSPRPLSESIVIPDLMTVFKNPDDAASTINNKSKKERKRANADIAGQSHKSTQRGSDGKVPFSLTYVMYDPSDVYGELMAVITLAPIFIVVMYVTIIAIRRDIGTFFVFLGQLIGVAINVVVKKMVKEPRPDGAYLDDEGMPSNHAQFIFFFAVYYILELLFRSKRRVCPLILRLFYSLVLLFVAILVSFSRVYLSYHTLEQVIVGAGLGTFNATLWSCICKSKLVLCFCEYLCKTWLFQFLAVRNYAAIEYAAIEEYVVMNGYIANLEHLPNFLKSSKSNCCAMNASPVSSFSADKDGSSKLSRWTR